MSLIIPIKPLILVGCAGSGRNAIIFHLTYILKHKFGSVISHTSRPPRQLQKDNIHFHFMTEEQMLKQKQQNLFLTTLKSPNSNYYGLSHKEIKRVMDNHKIPVFKMTLQAYKANIRHNLEGRVFISKQSIQCNSLYVTVDIGELQRRLEHSPFCKEECLQKINNARREQEEAAKFFMQEDLIQSKEMQETLMKIKSRLFELY